MGHNMEALTRSIGELFLDGKYSDLEIRCPGKSFKVHRAVVCNRSAVLSRECDDGFMEGYTFVIEQSTFAPDTLEHVLQFMYRGDNQVDAGDSSDLKQAKAAAAAVEKDAASTQIGSDTSASKTADKKSNTPQTQKQDNDGQSLEGKDLADDQAQAQGSRESDAVAEILTTHALVFAAAELYQIQALEELAASKFKEAAAKVESITITPAWFTVVATRVYALTSGSSKLRKEVLRMALAHKHVLLGDKDFLKAAQEDDDLRQFASQLLHKMHLLQHEAQRAILNSNARLGRADGFYRLRKHSKRHPGLWGTRYMVTHCECSASKNLTLIHLVERAFCKERAVYLPLFGPAVYTSHANA